MRNKFQRLNCSELDNISLTALRILSIFHRLLEGPCGDKELNEKLKEDIEGSRSLSKDTICIYLNTLRFLGCVISRPTKKNDFKYVLSCHSFRLSLTKEEIEAILTLRKLASTFCKWETVIEIDNLFNNIIKQATPCTKKNFLNTKKSSLTREITSEDFIQNIKQLEKYCKENKTITLLYDSPDSGKKNIILNAEKITMDKGAFYLWGYNEELQTTMYLRLDKILEIKAVSLKNSEVSPKSLLVTYKLKYGNDFSAYIPEEDTIIDEAKDAITIESMVTNKFSFFQRILEYGNDCTILAPKEIKLEIATKLKNMLEVYNDNGDV